MYIQSLELKNFRNFEDLNLSFSKGTNIFYGDNAQGKTNILEALFLISTTRSHRSVKDRDLIRFGEEESHIRSVIIKKGIDYQVDMHLRKSRSKGIAIQGQRIRKASQLIGLLHIVFFSPEDLGIVKEGPAGRRRFMDMELCQLDASYLYDLNNYNKVIEQRNRYLKDISGSAGSDALQMLDVFDEQLLEYGRRIIARRQQFMEALADDIGGIHESLTGGRETLLISYEPNVTAEDMEEKLKKNRRQDLFQKMSCTGPHRDDFSFYVIGTNAAGAAGRISDPIDVRKFGSQGQQRTCALSLKLSEIETVRTLTGEDPVLMLDDVLSELDGSRQRYLLDTIGSLQTLVTCTGLDDFVGSRFEKDRIYRVENGSVRENG